MTTIVTMNTRMQIPLPHVPTKDVALSRYIPKMHGMGRGQRRRRGRKSRGGGRPLSLDGLSPGIWDSHPYIQATRGYGRHRRRQRHRRHRGGCYGIVIIHIT